MSYEDDELGSPRPMFATDRRGIVHDNRCERITHPNSAHPCNCARYVLQSVLDIQQTAAARNTRMDAMVSNDFETLSTLVTEKNETIARLRAALVHADTWFKEMANAGTLDATADLRAHIAKALA